MRFSIAIVNKFVGKLLLLLFGVGAAILISEVGLRMFVDQQRKRLSIYDPQLGWRGRPHGSGIYSVPEDNIRARYAYNNYGFRDEDIVEPTSNEPRIVLLGDSFLECLELEYDDIYHEIVERQIQQAVDEKSQVIILGAQGYSTSQELLAFRKYEELLHADVVLTVFYTGNDFKNNQRKQYAYLDPVGNLVFPENNESWCRNYYMHARRWIYENCHLVFLLKNLVQARTEWNVRSNTKAESQESEQYRINVTRQLLLQTRADVEKSGAHFGIIVIPSKSEVVKDNFEKNRVVSAWCQEYDIPYLDLSQVLSPNDYFHEDRHFNKRGHAIVADEIYRFLQIEFNVQPNSGDSQFARR